MLFRLVLLHFFLAIPISFAKEGMTEIQFIDPSNQKPIPLVQMETVHGDIWVSDNQWRVAIMEPDLLGKEVFFHIYSHGYSLPKDGFGFIGKRLLLQPSKRITIELPRKQLAVREGRITGLGKYRDSQLLGYETPTETDANTGNVSGQDSVQTLEFAGKRFWFWGDSNRLAYPLGQFRMSGATTELNYRWKADASSGFQYFIGADGFSRPMMPHTKAKEGVIWMGSFVVLPNAQGEPTMVGHYSRRKGLEDQMEHGFAEWNAEKAIFESIQELPLQEKWRHPAGHPGHPIRTSFAGTEYFLFGSPNPNLRVPATRNDFFNSKTYEAFALIEIDKQLHWQWQKQQPPSNSQDEAIAFHNRAIPEASLRFYPLCFPQKNRRVQLHNGTVRWNAYLKKWLLVAGEVKGKSSFLGEVWISVADEPTGPFRHAVQVLTHDRQSFYNVCHHDFWDQDGGKIIYFEGTYTRDFSNNPVKTPRYDYNQVLYSLDLGQPEIQKMLKP